MFHQGRQGLSPQGEEEDALLRRGEDHGACCCQGISSLGQTNGGERKEKEYKDELERKPGRKWCAAEDNEDEEGEEMRGENRDERESVLFVERRRLR